MSWRDPDFRYIQAASHADATAFRRRQQARQRAAELARKAEAAAQIETAIRVRPIRKQAT